MRRHAHGAPADRQPDRRGSAGCGQLLGNRRRARSRGSIRGVLHRDHQEQRPPERRRRRDRRRVLHQCVIENNLLVWDGSDRNVTAIAAPITAREDADEPLEALTVRNNTIVTASVGTGIAVGDEGEGHVVVSNALLYTGKSAAWNCFDANLPSVELPRRRLRPVLVSERRGRMERGLGRAPRCVVGVERAVRTVRHCPGRIRSSRRRRGRRLTTSRPSSAPGIRRCRRSTTSSGDRGSTLTSARTKGRRRRRRRHGRAETDDTALPVDSGGDWRTRRRDGDDGCGCGAVRPRAAGLALLGMLVARRRR